MTKRVFSDLRQLFGFGLDRDYVDADPTARIKKHKIGNDIERDRVLSEAELIDFFHLLPKSGLIESSQCALLIQLATITRIGEVLGARWENVDFERRIWTLPETKNGRRHLVQLNDIALSQFEALRHHTELTEWVFPASRLNGPVCPKTVTKQVADRQRGGNEDNRMSGRTKQTDALLLKGGQWRPHDLRRTGATLMAELGVLPDVIERCLNHVEQVKIKRIYQRAQYEAPMREAWQRLGDRLTLLASKPDNVVTFQKTA
jgi:integrase